MAADPSPAQAGQLEARAAIPTRVTVTGEEDEELVNMQDAEDISEPEEGALRDTLYIDQGQDQQQTFENQDQTMDCPLPLAHDHSSIKQEIQFIHGNLQEAHFYHMNQMLNTGETYAKQPSYFKRQQQMFQEQKRAAA